MTPPGLPSGEEHLNAFVNEVFKKEDCTKSNE